MSEIIAALLERADLVLFDAPPVLAVTDAAVLSSKVDGVLLVVSAGKTKRENAEKSANAARKNQCPRHRRRLEQCQSRPQRPILFFGSELNLMVDL